VLGLGVALLIAVIKTRVSLDTDDAYITYRYAQNLAAGHGFVYNIGERVLGTSTPLFAMLLALFRLAGVEIPRAALWLNILSSGLAGSFCFLWLLAETRSRLAAIVGYALLVSASTFLLWNISGMETATYLALIVATFWMYGASRWAIAGALAGLVVLLRLDGAALAFALAAHLLLRRNFAALRTLVLWLAAPLVPWIAFSGFYFGSPVPQSMLAKHLQDLQAPRFWMVDALANYKSAALSILVIVAFLGVRNRRWPASLGAFGIWSVCYVTAYTVYRLDLYGWYLSPVMLILAVLPAFALGRLIEAWAAEQSIRSPLAIAALTVLPVVALQVRDAVGDMRTEIHWTNTVEQARADIAKEITTSGTSSDVIGTGAIGIVGWDTKMRIVDMMGLVSRHVLGRNPLEVLAEARASWYVTQAPSANLVSAEVPGYDFVRAANRGGPVTFLLYRMRGGLTSSTPMIADQGCMIEFTAGLKVCDVSLSASSLKFKIVALLKQDRNYKVFVHVYRRGDLSGVPTKQYDFYLLTATSQMRVGAAYEVATNFSGPLPKPCDVSFGLFDEADPSFTRLTDKAHRGAITMACPG
jgi:hypothetical protein